MDVTSIATLITNSSIAALILATVIAALIWHRTGSSHTLMNRLWATFNGKKSCALPSIQTAIDEQAALMQFRFTTGLKARTVTQAEALIQWARENDESVTDIAACGHYFNLENQTLKGREAYPKTWRAVLAALAIITLSLASAITCLAMGQNKTLLQFTDSRTLFWIDTRSADTLWHTGSLPLKECTTTPVAELIKRDVGFSAEEISIICKQAASLTSETVRKSVSEARWALFALLVCFLVGLYFSSGFFHRVINAMDMAKRLANRSAAAQATSSSVLSEPIP